MTDQLSIEQKQAKMVEAELASGRWISTQDERGRTVYYNPTSKETTRDLRLHLLRQSGWDMLSARQREMKESREKKTRDIDITTIEEQLRRELGDAKALIEAYESEVTWLRLALLEAEKKLDPGELAVAETSSRFFLKNPPPAHHYHQHHKTSSQNNNINADAASLNNKNSSSSSSTLLSTGKVASDYEDEIKVLTQKLDESRKLNRKLLQRVSQDREQKNLCSRCLQDVELAIGLPSTTSSSIGMGGGANSSSALSHNQYSLTVPGGVGFPTTLSNPATHDAIMLSRGLHELQVTSDNEKGITHPAAVTGPVGYLPRSYDPMKLSLNGATTGWESPMRRIQESNKKMNSGGGVNNNNTAVSNFDPSTLGFSTNNNNASNIAGNVAETPFHKNLQGLQLLRSSLEGEYPLDAHIRDSGRNDFFKSSYFTASLRGKTAGSGSNDLSMNYNNNNNNNGLNQSNNNNNASTYPQNQNSSSASSSYHTPSKTTSTTNKNFVNQPTPSGFYKSGTLNVSTF